MLSIITCFSLLISFRAFLLPLRQFPTSCLSIICVLLYFVLKYRHRMLRELFNLVELYFSSLLNQESSVRNG